MSKLSGLWFYGAAIVFRTLLDISYYLVVSDVFAYEGYLLNFSKTDYALSWLLYLLSFTLSGTSLNRVSDYFFATALLSVVAPLTSIYGLDAARPLLPVVAVLISISVLRFIVRLKFISFRSLPVVKNGQEAAIAGSLAFVFFLILWYLGTGTSFNLNFAKVYEYRSENSELASGGIFAYTNNWTYKIFNLFLMAFALFYKRYVVFLVLFVIQIYFFGVSSHKTVLFLPIMLLGIWFYLRKTSSLVVLPATFSVLIAATLISYFFLDDVWMSTLFSRRVFYVPAHLTFVYFEFFSFSPKVLWSNSIFSSFLQYPYDVTMTHAVGKYMGREAMGANNGFVASGYAHAGLWGIAIYTIIVGFILRFIDDITRDYLPVWLAVALCIVPLRSLLISSDLFTVMLTHGLFVAIVLIFLARKNYA